MKRRVAAIITAAILIIAAVFLVAKIRQKPAAVGEPATEQRERKYSESPMLKDRVERGELPPVEKRLPDEPMVIKPVEGVGRFDSEPKSSDSP
jgi:hypothetical protein